MERKAALWLALLLVSAVSAAQSPTTEKIDLILEPSSKATTKEVKLTTEEITTKKLDYDKLLNPKETLLQEIRSLDEEASTDRVSKHL